MRGCVFAESFRSASEVVGNGGTITGTPTFDNGVDLDGSNDYITYSLQGTEFDSASISFVIEFTPDFAVTEDAIRYLFGSNDGATNYSCFVHNNATGNRLYLYLGNTLIAFIEDEDYSQYWLANQRNVMVISGTSGNTSIWLNGTQILTADPTAWTPVADTGILIGSRSGGINLFDGTIHSFKVFQSALTAQESSDYYTNSTYDYMNDTVVDLPMSLETHDPVNNRTLDVSGNGLHGTLGAGDGGVTTPTKNSDRCGYSMDGSDDYITLGSNALLRPTTEVTVAIWSKSNDSGNDEIVNYRENAGSGLFALYQIGTLTCGIKTSDDTSELVTKDATQQVGTWDLTVLTFAQDDQQVKVYVNGVLQTDVEATGDFPLATELAGLDEMYIGCAKPTTRHFNGDCAYFKLWDKRLTHLQVNDLYQRELKKLNCA